MSLFLSGLMDITLFGFSLPILVLIFFGTYFLGSISYKDKFLSFWTLAGVLCFYAVAWMIDFNWRSIFAWWTAAYILAWILLGALWFLFKWNLFVSRARANADKELVEKKDFRKRNGHKSMLIAEENELMLKHKPELEKNKERAISWLLLWPFSMLAYIFGDLLHDFAEWIIKRLGGIAKLITKRHFGEFEPIEETSK